MLARPSPKKLYILLGTNTLTTAGAEDRFLTYYGPCWTRCGRRWALTASIYVQSIPPVRPRGRVAQRPGLSSDNLRAVNEQLAQLAHSKGCV